MSNPILSILICSLDKRLGMLASLLRQIDVQIKENDAEDKVEIRINLDSKQKTTGKKRQELLEVAKGDYVVFADDDDDILPGYIQEFLIGCESGADVISPNGYITTNGSRKIDWKISKDYKDCTVRENYIQVYLRRPNHISAVRREIALSAGFPDISCGEDKEYSNRIEDKLKTEYKIEKQIYHYKFSTHNKEY